MSDITLSGASLSGETLLNKSFSFVAADHGGGKVGFENDPNTDTTITVDGITYDAGSIAQPLEEVTLHGSTLTVKINNEEYPNIASGVTYQWYKDGVAITGETSTNYTLKTADVGSSITFTATYTNTSSQQVVLTTPAASNIVAANSQGIYLEFPGSLPSADLNYSIKHLENVVLETPVSHSLTKDGVAVPIASDNSYAFLQGDLGSEFILTTNWKDTNGVSRTASSTLRPVLASIDTEQVVGYWKKAPGAESLFANIWNYNFGTLASQTFVLSSAQEELIIDGTVVETNSGIFTTFTSLTPADVGKSAKIRLSYSLAGSQDITRTAETEERTIVASNVPRTEVTNHFVLSGTLATPRVSFLDPDTAGLGIVDNAPVYEWIVNDAVVSTRSTASDLASGAWGELAEEQLNVGDTVRVRLTYTNELGVSAVYNSNTLTIADVNTASSVKLLGEPREGSRLTLAQLITDNSAGSVTYEYYNDGVLSGTSSTPLPLTLGQHQKWKIKAKYTNSEGEEVVLESAEAPEVTNIIRLHQSETKKWKVIGVGTQADGTVFNAATDATSIKWFLNGVEQTEVSSTLFERSFGRDSLIDGQVYTAKVLDDVGTEYTAYGEIRLTAVESTPTHPITFNTPSGFYTGQTATFSVDFPEDKRISNTQWDSISINGQEVTKNYTTTFDSSTGTFTFTDTDLEDLFDTGDLVFGNIQKDFLKKDTFSTVSSTFEATASVELGSGDSGANLRFTPKSSKNRPLKNFHAVVYFKSDRGLQLNAIKSADGYVNSQKASEDPTLAGLHNFSLYIDDVKITEMGTVPVTFKDLEYDRVEVTEETILSEASPQKSLTLKVSSEGIALTGLDSSNVSITLADSSVQGITIGDIGAHEGSNGGYPFLVSWDTTVAPQEGVKLNVSITTTESGTRTFTSDLDFTGSQPVIHTRAASIKDLSSITIPSTTIPPGTPVSVSVILRDAIANYGATSTIQVDKVSGPGTFTQPVVQPSQQPISLDLNDPSVVTPGVRAAFFPILTQRMVIHLDNHGLSTGQAFAIDQDLDLESESPNQVSIGDLGDYVYIIVIDDNNFTFAENAAEAIANRSTGIFNHINTTLTLTSAEDTVIKTTFNPGTAVGEEVSFRATITRPWGDVENTDLTTFLISDEDNVILLKGGDDIKLFKGDAYNEKGYMLITRDYSFDAPVWEPFGGATASGDQYAFPSSGDSWGGFANTNTVLEGLTLDRGIVVNFDGRVVSGSSTNVNVIFKFERLPYDESTIDSTGIAQSTVPSHFSPVIQVVGTDVKSYSFTIPAQTSLNSYSSFLMYLQTQDTTVELTNFTFEKVGKELNTGVSISGSVDTSQTGINTLTYNYLNPVGKKRAVSKTRTIGILDQFLFWTDESITLLEGIPEGTVLYTAQATSSSPVVYELAAPSPSGLVIDSSTGEVKFPYDPSNTDYATDYEQNSQWSFYVRASSGGQQITKQIFVNIQNVDELGPEFAGGLGSFNFVVEENVPAGSIIGQMGLSERDYENTSTGLSLTYSDGGSDPEVVINANGTIELSVDTDAETKTTYNYKAGAVDAAGNIYAESDGTPNYVEGTITVNPTNDELPRILGPKTIHIPGSLVNGHFIHDVILSDTDTAGTSLSVTQIGGDSTLNLSVESTLNFGDIYRIYSTSPNTAHTSRSVVLRVSDGVNQRVETLTFVTDDTMPTIAVSTTSPWHARTGGGSSDLFAASVSGGAEGVANNSSWNLVTGMEALTKDFLEGVGVSGPNTNSPFSINASTGVVSGVNIMSASANHYLSYVQLTLQDGRVAALKRLEIEHIPDTTGPSLPVTVSTDQFLRDYPLSTSGETILARLSNISDSPNNLFPSASSIGANTDNLDDVYIHSSYSGSVRTAIRNFGTVETPDWDYCLRLPGNATLSTADSSIPLRIKDIANNITSIDFEVRTFSGLPAFSQTVNQKITNTGVVPNGGSLGALDFTNDTYLYRVTPHATLSDAQAAQAFRLHHASSYSNTAYQEEITLNPYESVNIEMDDDTGAMTLLSYTDPTGTYTTGSFGNDKTTYTIYVLVSTTLGDTVADYQIVEVEVNLFRYYSVGFQEQYPNLEFLHMHRGDNANDIGTIQSDRPQGDSGHYFIIEGSDKNYYKIENGVLKTKDATEADGSTPWHNHNQFASSTNNNHTIRLEMYPVGQAATSQYLVGKSDDIDITFFKENIGVHTGQPPVSTILGYNSIEIGSLQDVPNSPGNYKMMGNYSSNLVTSNLPVQDHLPGGATNNLVDNESTSIQPTKTGSTTSNPLVYIRANVPTEGGYSTHTGTFMWQATNFVANWDNGSGFDRVFFIEKNSSGHKFVNGGQITKVGNVPNSGQINQTAYISSALSSGKTAARYPINPRDGSARPWPFEAGKTYSVVYASKDP